METFTVRRKYTRWSRELLIERLQELAREHGRTPTATWLRTHGSYALADVTMLNRHGFKSYADLVRAAELAPTPPPGRQPVKQPGSESNSKSAAKRLRVPGTGLAYRDVDEALVAADEIEADGERVAAAAHDDSPEKANEALARSRELANKIRAAARNWIVDDRAAPTEREPQAEEPPVESVLQHDSPGPSESVSAKPVAAGEPSRSAGAELAPREAPPGRSGSPLIRLLQKLPQADLDEAAEEMQAEILSLQIQLSIVERALAEKNEAA